MYQIQPNHKLHFNGTQFVYKRFPTLLLLLLFVVPACLLLFPASVNPSYSHNPSVASEPASVLEPTPPPPTDVALYIKQTNKTLSDADALMFATFAIRAATDFKLDLAHFLALIKVESGFKPEAASNMGAMGLTQVIPKWHKTRIEEARKIVNAYSIYEPALNMYVGAWALRDFLNESKSLDVALLKYNGSASDPKMEYARMVQAEAYNVRINYLKSAKL
jgi:hypothetical protein